MKRVITPLFAVVAGLGGSAAAGNDPATPRTLPTGAPACGNAQTKSPRPCATPPAVQVAVTPRALPTGAPACGNVLAKADGNQQDPIYISCVNGEAPGVEVRQRMVLAKLFRVLGLQTAAFEVREPAPAAKPRQMRNGAPACGNVASRMARNDRNCE